MTPLETWFVVVGGLAMIVFWSWALIRVKIAREKKIPDEVQKTSHEIKNEVMKIRAGLKAISCSPDPIKELTKAMREHRDDPRP